LNVQLSGSVLPQYEHAILETLVNLCMVANGAAGVSPTMAEKENAQRIGIDYFCLAM